MLAGALAGLRVLDLCDQSGALAGKLLAGLGADVVLVEPPTGSALRTLPPFWDGASSSERSLFFWFYAAGKRSLTLDLVRDEDWPQLRALAACADVVLETSPPGTLARQASAPEDLRRLNPRLVVASITPFGQSGPYRDWRATDLIAEAMGGLAAVNGHPDGPPLQALGLQAYHQAGIQTATAVLTALLARETTGRGQHIDVSVQAAVAAALEHVPGFFHQNGWIPNRQGTLHWTRFFRVGRCRDGYVMHCTLGDWTSLVEWMKADGMADNLEEPAWDSIEMRREAAEHVFDVLDAWALRYTVAELHEGAQLRRIPYAAVRPPEALLRDPQLAARGFFVALEHPDLGVTLPYPGAPFKLTDSPWQMGRPPRLGEHTAIVRREWLRA